ncbi:hypothetical protein TNCV_3099041 [Trichonephila clavipes]|nr:hypothetical protein TNCV_3099041 [Trichonephila clavipes]
MEGVPYCNLYRSKFGDKKIWRPKVGPPRIQPSHSWLLGMDLVALSHGRDEDDCSPHAASREGVNINVELFSYTRVFGNGSRHFEPWSSGEDYT